MNGHGSNRVQELFAQAGSIGEFARGYFSYLGDVLQAVDTAAIERFVQVLLTAREQGGHIVTMGNGGSSATAGHFANDLLISVRAPGKPFRAQSLSENVAVLTAVGNDFGYDQVFARQLEGRLGPGDVAIAFTASGNSPNILAAMALAKAQGATTVGFTGFDGGKLRPMVDVSLHVPTQPGEYGPAEDAQLALEHMISAWLHHQLRAPTG